MKPFYTFWTFLLAVLLINSSAFAVEKYWVFFKDKGHQSSSLPQILTELANKWPERSLKRRQKSGKSLDDYDLEVAPEYLTAIAGTGAKVISTSRWLNAASVELNQHSLQEVTQQAFVKSIQPVASFSNSDMNTAEVVGAKSIIEYQNAVPSGAYGQSLLQAKQAGAVEAHHRGYTGRGVFLGIMDTGFQLDHRAFTGMELVAQYDFIFNDADPSWDPGTDPRGQANHGTGCLSVIAGYEAGRLVGIAPGVSVAVAKTEYTGRESRVEEDYWIAGLEWLEWLGVDVISSSLSYRKWYTIEDYNGIISPASRAAQRAYELGIVICNSAGNEGPGRVTIGAPADAPGVLAVAAVDSMGEIVGFSSRGPSSDGRIKPDIAALGRGVVCVTPMTWSRYSRWNGTSLACPIVAGVAALVLEAHPDWSSQQVTEAMLETARNAERPGMDYGYGIVNAVEAIDYPSVSGRLVNPERLEIDFENILVRLKGADAEFEMKTDTRGGYRFVNLPKGEYVLKVFRGDELLHTREGLMVPPSLPVDVVLSGR